MSFHCYKGVCIQITTDNMAALGQKFPLAMGSQGTLALIVTELLCLLSAERWA